MENVTSQSEENIEEVKNDLMESMELNNSKETSAEDILGAQSLLVSDSENEDEDKEENDHNNDTTSNADGKEGNELANKAKQTRDNGSDVSDKEENFLRKPRKSARNFLDSEEEDDLNDLGSTKTDQQVQMFKKKVSSLIDSESDDEKPPTTDSKTISTSPDIKASDKKPSKKFSTLIDSESEEEIQTKGLIDDNRSSEENNNQKEKEKKFPNNLSRSDSETDSGVSRKKKKIKKLSKKQKVKINSEGSGSDSSDEDVSDGAKKSKHKSKMSDLIDSDHDSSKSDISNTELDDLKRSQEDGENSGNENENKNDKPKKMRASAKKALDEMQTIQSEQQRLHREAHISIPYHKPKKHTLEEFLQRRTIVKPSSSSDKASPSAIKIPTKSLKMTTEELEEYAKLMEERAKEATEFFKSESEEEDESVMKDNPGVLDTPNDSSGKTEEITHSVNPSEKEESENQEKLDLMDNDDNAEKDLLEPTTPKSLPLEAKISPGRILITEVLELPKLDLSSANIKVDENAAVSPSFSKTLKESPRPSVSKPRSENKMKVLQSLAPEKLYESPTLKGDKDMLIDLDSGEMIAKKPSGVDNLLQRLLATKKARKEKKPDSVDILSVENGKVEMSKVHINLHDDEDSNTEHKPGASYFKLQNNLKNLITKKRLEHLQQKKAEEKKKNGVDEEMEGEDEELEEEEEMEEYEPDTKLKKIKTENIVVDDEENAFVLDEAEDDEEVEDMEIDDDDENEAESKAIRKIKKEEEDEEEEEEALRLEDEDEDDEEEEEESTDDNDDEDNNDENKKKNRIIKAFQDDSDEETHIDFLKTPKMQTFPSSYPAYTQQQPGQGVLFEKESKRSLADEENELIDLCSGQFDPTQAETQTQTQQSMKSSSNIPFISQIPMTQAPLNPKDANDELLELCSGAFDEAEASQPSATQLKTKGNKILSSDEEEADADIEEALNEDDVNKSQDLKRKIKKLRKRLKKGEMKLGFSDDEEEEVLENAEEDEDDEILEEAEEDQPQEYIDYDSEENEVVVEMTKKDRVMKAANFVEKEAELSESEWGSADEDEKNLDKYDIELGDEDEFDREQLRDEVGKIHARKMLDEDAREIKKLQEMFVEDEERDGVGRQRQFRWKNAESGFSLDTEKKDDDPDNNAESGDEENEHVWRKIRFEREQLLKEKMEKETSLSLSSSISTSPNVTALNTTKKINIITSKSTTITKETKKGSPFLISKTVSSLHKKTVRGSFLVRDKETLNKLAGLTKGGSSMANAETAGTAGTVSVKNTNAKNFVFATLTEEEHETLKRKADDLINSSTENGINYMKKPKIEPRRDKCVIDQLL